MEIKVTKENIKNGTPDSSEKCAVALALKETLGSEYTVGVFPYRDKYQDDEDSTDCYYFAIDKIGKPSKNYKKNIVKTAIKFDFPLQYIKTKLDV